jgi:hypothetical protein
VVQCTERWAVAPQPVRMTVDEIFLEGRRRAAGEWKGAGMLLGEKVPAE